MTATTYQRFAAKVDVGADGCWRWTAAKNFGGYGVFAAVGRRLVMAHRWAYEAWVGRIPDGLVIDHLCRTPSCVNPAHLEAVTQRENLRRSDVVTGRRSAATHCPQGHEYTHENTRRAGGRRHCRMCGH